MKKFIVSYTNGVNNEVKGHIDLASILADVENDQITDCPFKSCALNSGNGGCVSTNTKQCESIPPHFDEDKLK